MGPQLYRCGNVEWSDGTKSCRNWLQWGRNFIVAETSTSRTHSDSEKGRFNGAATLSLRKHSILRATRTLTHTLQWGRNFIVAETRRWSWHQATYPSCFNGAATLSLRKLSHTPSNYQNDYCFNGAATLSLRKHRLLLVNGTYTSLLQWGRNFIVAETCQVGEISRARSRLQWGRNFIVAETEPGDHGVRL